MKQNKKKINILVAFAFLMIFSSFFQLQKSNCILFSNVDDLLVSNLVSDVIITDFSPFSFDANFVTGGEEFLKLVHKKLIVFSIPPCIGGK